MLEYQIGELEPVGCQEVGGWWQDTLAAATSLGSQAMLAKREKQAMKAGLNPSSLVPSKPAVDIKLWAGVAGALALAWLVFRR